MKYELVIAIGDC